MAPTKQQLEQDLTEKGFKYNKYFEYWTHAVSQEIYTLLDSMFIHTGADGTVLEMGDYG